MFRYAVFYENFLTFSYIIGYMPAIIIFRIRSHGRLGHVSVVENKMNATDYLNITADNSNHYMIYIPRRTGIFVQDKQHDSNYARVVSET